MSQKHDGDLPGFVVVKRLDAPHPEESFTHYRPLSSAMVSAVGEAVRALFEELGGPALLKPSGDVYIKPNAVDARPYTHTRPEVVRAAIEYWLDAGARNVYLFENATQGNYTRIVFEATGYAGDTGAVTDLVPTSKDCAACWL